MALTRPIKSETLSQRVTSNLTPQWLSVWKKYKDTAYAAQARRDRRQRYGVVILKTLSAAAIYQATAATYGVDARDYALDFNAQSAWSKASKLSVTVAGAMVSIIPPAHQEWVASAIIPAEWFISTLRIYVEHKVWKARGITPDPVGTLLTPVIAGIGELGYKAGVYATGGYPTEARARNMIGFVGIYGNLVRMFNAGVIYLAGKALGWHNEQEN